MSPVTNSKKILIVEDEKPMTRALELKLTNAGFKITAVYNGEEAEDILKKESFDLILLDLVLPKKDGFAVLAFMKLQKNKTPVIVTSNLSQDEDKIRSKELGALDYLVKSDTSLMEVVNRVKKALEK